MSFGLTGGSSSASDPLKEDIANRETDSTFASNSDSRYPTSKAVKAAIAVLAALITTNTTNISTNTTNIATNTAAISAVPYINPRTGGGRAVDDWVTAAVSGHYAWLSTSNSGAVAVSITAQGTSRTGVININTSTSATAAPRLSGGGSNTHLAIGLEAMLFDTDIEVRTLSTSAEEYILRIGMTDVSNNSTDPSNGVFFKYDRATNGNFWELVTRNAGTSTSTVTAIPVAANTYYKLKIWTNAAGTSVKFYIDDVLAGTHTTNIPTGTSKTVSQCWQMIKTNGTTLRDFNVDLVIFGWGSVGAPDPG